MANLDSIKSHKRPAHLLIDEGPSRAAVGPRAELIIYVYQYTFGNLNFRFFFLHCRVSVEQQKQKVIQLLPHKSEIQTCNLHPATYNLQFTPSVIRTYPHRAPRCAALRGVHDTWLPYAALPVYSSPNGQSSPFYRCQASIPFSLPRVFSSTVSLSH